MCFRIKILDFQGYGQIFYKDTYFIKKLKFKINLFFIRIKYILKLFCLFVISQKFLKKIIFSKKIFF